ncbi:MAG TPA: sensor histidine kinase [Candidatus Dormibacteraeota bacterium]|nr:sensor histidine kinase [Candidatus Dormibacteraeota bacterium]
MRDRLLHAMDLAAVHDWDGSKALLESMDDPIAGRFFMLVCDLEQEADSRAKHSTMLRHEVGNALTIAQANLEGLIDGVLAYTPERLNGVLASVASASAMIEEIANVPAAVPLGDVIRIETFNICSLIAAHAAAIAGLATAKNVRIVYDPCGAGRESCTSFRGDISRVGQILRNVLLNAVRYTPPGGTVEIHCDRPGSELMLIVSDTGIGIASDDVPHLFEPGYRGRNASGKGSGIGLNVVQKLLASLGGNVKVATSEGRGSAFIITLPTIPLLPAAARNEALHRARQP